MKKTTSRSAKVKALDLNQEITFSATTTKLTSLASLIYKVGKDLGRKFTMRTEPKGYVITRIK